MSNTFQVFDTRDNGKDASLQYSTWSQMLNIAWNSFAERSLSGFRESHEKAMEELIAQCNKDEIIAVCYHNYAVSLIVKTHLMMHFSLTNKSNTMNKFLTRLKWAFTTQWKLNNDLLPSYWNALVENFADIVCGLINVFWFIYSLIGGLIYIPYKLIFRPIYVAIMNGPDIDKKIMEGNTSNE